MQTGGDPYDPFEIHYDDGALVVWMDFVGSFVLSSRIIIAYVLLLRCPSLHIESRGLLLSPLLFSWSDRNSERHETCCSSCRINCWVVDCFVVLLAGVGWRFVVVVSSVSVRFGWITKTKK